MVFLALTTFVSYGQFVVTNNADNGPGSLRDAVQQANLDPANNTITFNANYTIALTTGQITSTDNLVITGTGAGNTVLEGSGNGNERALVFNAGTISRIEGITFQNFNENDNGGAVIAINLDTFEMEDCAFIDNTANGSIGGGALLTRNTNLTVLNSTFTGNNASNATSGSGGAIIVDLGGALTVINSTFIDNSAFRAGGAIETNSPDPVLISASTFQLNEAQGGTAPGNGGAFHVSGSGNSTFTECIIQNNTAVEGGGLWNGAGTMTIDGNAIDANTASGMAADQGGGALFNSGGTMAVINTTLTNNSANGVAGSGGAILNDGGSLTVTTSLFDGNTAVRAGGAIEDNSLPGNLLTITDVDFENNATAASPGNGGALHITGAGDAIITGGTANNNTAAAEGGAFWNGTGTMVIDDVDFADNIASGADADQGGGALFNAGGNLQVENSFFLNNVANGASGSGGGILNDQGSLTVTASIFTANTANRAGGGIEDNSVSGNVLELTDVEFDNNIASAAPGNGGAVHITGAGDSVITGGNASSNTAASEGGGYWNGTGLMQLDGVTVAGNIAAGDAADNGGGGLFNNGGTIDIINATQFIGNQATGISGSGGALFSTAGDVTITDASFMSNSANRAGGAIEIIDGALTFTSSEMIENDVNGEAGTPNPGNGGGLHVSGNSATVSILTSLVAMNEAAREGGGLWNQSGTNMSVSETTIRDNQSLGSEVTQGGAGIFNNGGIVNIANSTISNNIAAGATSSGGGIHNASSGTLSIAVSTISTNTANGAGGGVYNNGALAEFDAVTVANNEALASGGGIASVTNTTLINTIVALNSSGAFGTDLSGIFVSNGYNLIGTDDANIFPENSNDLEEVDPLLGPLQDNGGNTFTHQLLEGSVAYNAGNPADLFDDQINQPVFDDIRDIGAFEAQQILLNVQDISKVDTGIAIYPNPSNGVATVAIPETFGTNISVTVVEVGSGKVVNQFKTSFGATRIDFGGMANGVYIVQITSGSATSTHRLILAK